MNSKHRCDSQLKQSTTSATKSNDQLTDHDRDGDDSSFHTEQQDENYKNNKMKSTSRTRGFESTERLGGSKTRTRKRSQVALTSPTTTTTMTTTAKADKGTKEELPLINNKKLKSNAPRKNSTIRSLKCTNKKEDSRMQKKNKQQPRRRKKKSKVKFSPKKCNQIYIADAYDRTPPEIDVYDCDGCGIKILGERHHCQECDYDLCSQCFTAVKQKEHPHNSWAIIPPDPDPNDNDP